MRIMPRPCACFRVVFGAAEIQFDVLSRGERFARPRDHHHFGLLLGFELVQRLAHLAMQFGTHRVALFRTVEDHKSNAVLALNSDCVVVAAHLNVPFWMPRSWSTTCAATMALP